MTIGFLLHRRLFDPAEVDGLRAGVEAAAARAVALAAADPGRSVRNERGHVLQTVPGDPPTAVHWEPGEAPVVRNLRPVTHLDSRLDALWSDPRLTGPAAELLGVPAVGPLTSKISFKRARVGSEFIWHQDHSFLAGFLGAAAAAEVVTAMVLVDDADADNGALTLVPGSHLDGPRPDGEPPRPTDREPVLAGGPAGTTVFFPSQMVHRSDANHSPRDRRALFYLFQPAGRGPLDET